VQKQQKRFVCFVCKGDEAVVPGSNQLRSKEFIYIECAVEPLEHCWPGFGLQI
jgi:hypothetical protein